MGMRKMNELPQDVKDTMAYKCSISVQTCDNKGEIREMMIHYAEKGHIIESLVRNDNEMLGTMYNDGSILIQSQSGKNHDLTILSMSMILKILMEYHPYKQLGMAEFAVSKSA